MRIEARRACRCDLVALVVTGACIGLVVGWASLELRFSTRADTIHNLRALLHGQPVVFGAHQMPNMPWGNRLMFPALHQGLSALFPILSESQWYVLLRAISFPVAIIGFGLACWRGLGVPRKGVTQAMSLLALALIVTFGAPWEEPTDAPDVLCFALGTWAALSNRFVICLVIAVVFALNRESAAFLGGCWFLLSTNSPWSVRKAVEAALISGASYGLALGVRILSVDPSTGHKYVGNFWAFDVNRRLLVDGILTVTQLNWLLLLVAVVTLLLCNVEWRNRTVQLFLLLALACFVPDFLYGIVRDNRVEIPSLVMLAFAVAASSVPERHTSIWS